MIQKKWMVLTLCIGFLTIIGNLAFSASKKTADTKTVATKETEEKVWIKQPDGGVSCDDPKDAKSLDQGLTVLKKAGVTVFESKKVNDGFMRAAVCGIPTGNDNTYLIPKDKLEAALKLGFQELASPGETKR